MKSDILQYDGTEIVSYDTETTGIPDWKVPSDDPSQPHLVQLGAIVVDAETREVIDTLDVIIKPDGWEIPDEVAEIHGITTERALTEGIPETEAVDRLLAMCAGRHRVAYNRTFDQRIIRIALKRYGYGQELMDAWGDKDTHDCSMLLAKPIMQLPPKGRYGYKSPKLSDAYKFFTGEELQNAHTALADAKACIAVYWGAMDHQEAGNADTGQKAG